MQKDTVIHTIHSVTLDPTRSNQVVTIHNIQDVVGQRQQLWALPGYLDIGLIDTMKDLIVNFPGGPGLLRHRLLLCPKQGQKENPRPELCPQQENRGPGLPSSRPVRLSRPRKSRRRTPDPHPFRPAQPPAARGASLPEPAGGKFSLERPSLPSCNLPAVVIYYTLN